VKSVRSTVKRRRVMVVALLCAVGLVLGPATAEGVFAEGRKVFEQHKSAVVTVQLVTKQRENESKSEVTGTVMEPDGLTVVSLSAVDPSNVYKAIMGPQDDHFEMESEVTSVKILLEDGAELDALLVLRDPDLDLAFVRPVTKPEKPLPHVDFTDAAEPEILDDLIAVSRLGKVARRTCCASVERIEGIVSKPRTFYIPSQAQGGTATLGCPAFSMEGKIVGIAVLRTVKGERFNMRSNMLVILVPASDILEAAGQAPGFEEGSGEGAGNSE